MKGALTHLLVVGGVQINGEGKEDQLKSAVLEIRQDVWNMRGIYLSFKVKVGLNLLKKFWGGGGVVFLRTEEKRACCVEGKEIKRNAVGSNGK